MPRSLLPTSFAPRSQPWITRQSYHYELISAMTLPIALSLIEGAVIGVLAKKAFEVSDLAFSALMAAPMFANLTSFAWTRLSRGIPKARFIQNLCLAVIACVAGIALLPTEGWGGAALVVLVIFSRCLTAGILTIRSIVWRHNYPRGQRAQVTGKLWLVNALINTAIPLGAYSLLDFNEESFRILYPLSALIALIGALSMGRVRLRGEKALLRYEQQTSAKPSKRGEVGSVYEYDPSESTPNTPARAGFWSVLKQDRFFRSYMLWQFVIGMAFMASETLIIFIIAQETQGLDNEYLISILLATAIPMGLTVAAMSIWARTLDRIPIVQFRVRQSSFWLSMMVMYFIGCTLMVQGQLIEGLVVVAIGRIINGIVRSGGMLAWQLGHNDFAARHMVSVYMGIHVTLTGVRGATAPFLVIILYNGWSSSALSWMGIQSVPSFQGWGQWVFMLLLIVAAIATLGFMHLDRQMRKRPKSI